MEELIACHDVILNYASADPISAFFGFCVLVLELIGQWTGMGYELANIVIFVVLQPLLIIFFLTLWLLEKRKNTRLGR